MKRALAVLTLAPAIALSGLACSKPPPPEQGGCAGGYEPPKAHVCPPHTRGETAGCVADVSFDARCPPGLVPVPGEWCVEAKAQPGSLSAETRAQVQALVEHAEAAERSGDLAAAIENTTRAFALSGSPRVLRSLARVEERAGRLASALVHYRRAEAQDAGAAAPVAALTARVPAVRVSAPEAPGLVVAIDRARLGDALRAAWIDLDPGKHVIVVTADGREPFVSELDLKEGERVELTAALGAIPKDGGRD